MADPLSVIGLVVSLQDITTSVYKYRKHVRESKNEILALWSELLAFKGVLEQVAALQDMAEYDQDGMDAMVLLQSNNFKNMLQSTRTFVDGLAEGLVKTKRRDQLMQIVKWPFTRDEMKDHRRGLERVKTWFILALTSDNVKVDSDTNKRTREIQNVVIEMRDEQRLANIAHAKEKTLQSIPSADPSGIHTKVCKGWQTGTGMWFLDSYVKDWANASHIFGRVLWLKGKSGSGKSTLASRVVEYVENMPSQNNAAAYFYCTFSNADTQDPLVVLGSLVCQLSERFPHLLDKYAASSQSKDEIEVWQLEESIIEAAQSCPRLLLSLDAINESARPGALSASVLRLVRSSENIRVFVTSTPEVDTTDYQRLLNPLQLPDTYPSMSRMKSGSSDNQFDSKELIFVEVHMRIDRVAPDIEAYIDACIAGSMRLNRLSPQDKAQVREVLNRQAEGVFRWVTCQIDHLSRQRTTKLVMRELGRLPDDLNETYVGILSRVSETDQVFVKEALMWLSYAHRQLSLQELSEAVVLTEEDTSIGPESRIDEPRLILGWCQSLIVYDEETDSVALAHSSVRAFLTSSYIQNTTVKDFAVDDISAVRSIVRKCLTYLLFDDFSCGVIPSIPLFRWNLKFPLLEYAATHWATHASNQGSCQQFSLSTDELDPIDKLFRSFRQDNGGNFSFWTRYLLPACPISVIRTTEPLYYAASFNLIDSVRRLLAADLKPKIDALGGRNSSTALQVACYRGHLDIAEILLGAGADPNTTDGSGCTCLFWAENNHFPVVADLLRRFGGRKYVRRRQARTHEID